MPSQHHYQPAATGHGGHDPGPADFSCTAGRFCFYSRQMGEVPAKWGMKGLTWNQKGLTWNGNVPEENPMPYNNINVTLTEQQKQAIRDGFAATEALMTWLVSLHRQRTARPL